MKAQLAWHFTDDPGKLANNGDTFEIGQKLSLGGEIVPCRHGFHGSPTVLDALAYIETGILPEIEIPAK